MSKPTVSRVTVTGSTSWSATTYKTVGRFRGTRDMEVAVRDAKGKPAMLAHREINIWIVCPDGVSYRFNHDADMQDEASVYLYVHGMKHQIRSYERDTVPAVISAAYERARRRVRVCLRVAAREIAALPKLRAIPVAKVAA